MCLVSLYSSQRLHFRVEEEIRTLLYLNPICLFFTVRQQLRREDQAVHKHRANLSFRSRSHAPLICTRGASPNPVETAVEHETN